MDRKKYERDIIEQAKCFYATAFRGRPEGFVRIACATLDEAREAAKDLYKDRPVMIYALYGGRQIHVENYDRSS